MPIEFLRPSPLQPRRRFAEAELEALAESIRERGILQPLLVRPAASGARRVTRSSPASAAGARRSVPGCTRCRSSSASCRDQETLELALIENLQRADLSPLDEAEAYRRLIDEFGHTQDELAEAVGKSRSHVANTLRLLSLPAAVQALVEDGSLTAGHARALLGCADAERLAQEVIEGGLNVRDTEALVRRETTGQRPDRRAGAVADPHVKELEERLTSHLGLEVGIRAKRSGGVLTIRYRDLGQLDGLIRRLQ